MVLNFTDKLWFALVYDGKGLGLCKILYYDLVCSMKVNHDFMWSVIV